MGEAREFRVRASVPPRAAGAQVDQVDLAPFYNGSWTSPGSALSTGRSGPYVEIVPKRARHSPGHHIRREGCEFTSTIATASLDIHILTK
jgi:hypothetical protein